jgi:hypothetical protein
MMGRRLHRTDQELNHLRKTVNGMYWRLQVVISTTTDPGRALAPTRMIAGSCPRNDT